MSYFLCLFFCIRYETVVSSHIIILINVNTVTINHSSISLQMYVFLNNESPFSITLFFFTSVTYVHSHKVFFSACVCLTACQSLTREGPSSGSDGLRCSPWEKQMSSVILKITFKVLLLPGDANHWPGWDRKPSAFKLKPCNFSSNRQRSNQTPAAFTPCQPAASGIFE